MKWVHHFTESIIDILNIDTLACLEIIRGEKRKKKKNLFWYVVKVYFGIEVVGLSKLKSNIVTNKNKQKKKQKQKQNYQSYYNSFP